jgi:RNA polymerase sigma factor, sigma-70 family
VAADETQDLAQLTLMKVSGHLPEFRGESSLSTWVYRIATNVALDRLRQRAPEGVAIEGGPDEEEFEGEALPAQLRAPSAEDAAMRTEMSACVLEFVGRLPIHYRRILVLSDIEGFTNGEIAEITGLSRG